MVTTLPAATAPALIAAEAAVLGPNDLQRVPAPVSCSSWHKPSQRAQEVPLKGIGIAKQLLTCRQTPADPWCP
jgi:hypothetical protein